MLNNLKTFSVEHWEAPPMIGRMSQQQLNQTHSKMKTLTMSNCSKHCHLCHQSHECILVWHDFWIFSHFLPSLANLGTRKATFGAPGWHDYILPGWSNLVPSLIVTFASRLLIHHHCLHIIHNIKRVPTVSTSYAWIYLVGYAEYPCD